MAVWIDKNGSFFFASGFFSNCPQSPLQWFIVQIHITANNYAGGAGCPI